jgi:hypothetical protein
LWRRPGLKLGCGAKERKKEKFSFRNTILFRCEKVSVYSFLPMEMLSFHRNIHKISSFLETRQARSTDPRSLK